MNTEFVRSLNCNYKRILLEEKPNEKRYQYVILGRGGISGLLSGGLQHLDGNSYLYYDVSSKQSLAQLFDKKKIDREWLRNFVRNYKQLGLELNRFLLDLRCVIWDPKEIFQEIDNQTLSFMYVPYFDGDSGFLKLCEFLVEHVDYGDEGLVECVYLIYEHAEQMGDAYLKDQLLKDTAGLEQRETEKKAPVERAEEFPIKETVLTEETEREPKKSLFGLFENKKKKAKDIREEYRVSMQKEMNPYMVAEDNPFPEYGRTLYIEETASNEVKNNKICAANGETILELTGDSVTIGKKKEEVDLVFEDPSVSRLHARLSKGEEGTWAIEDLNSTNGTYKNGLRLKPYERRELKKGDEIKIGRIVLSFE